MVGVREELSLLPVSALGRGPNGTEPGLQQNESNTEDEIAPRSCHSHPPSFAGVMVHFLMQSLTPRCLNNGSLSSWNSVSCPDPVAALTLLTSGSEADMNETS